MTDVGNDSEADGGQLRERLTAKPLQMPDSDSAKLKVLELNEQEDRKDEHEKKTYGRTPDGTGKCLPVQIMNSVVETSTWKSPPALPVPTC
jgi:phosphatidylethanolamine N-methyltransferase